MPACVWRDVRSVFFFFFAVCTCRALSASALAALRLPVWSSVRSWLLHLTSSAVIALVQLPAPAPLLHISALVHTGAVADAGLGLE